MHVHHFVLYLSRSGGNELHITPLSGVLNLKPHLKYLDKSDKTLKAEGRTLDNPDDPEEDTKDDIKAVTVRFAKSDGESAKKAREKSFEWQQKKAEEEPWVPTRFNQVRTN